MPIQHRILDISLLRADPDAFIVACQRIIDIVVRQFIGSGLFDKEDHDDIIQTINERLIHKLHVIDSQYNGLVLFATYLNVVIRNICLQIHRQQKRKKNTIPLFEITTEFGEPDNAIFIEEEIQRFRIIIQLFHKKKFRILLCLKIYFRIPIDEKNILNCFPQISDKHHEHLFVLFGTPFETMNGDEIFKTLTNILNIYEGKKNEPDSIRHWILDQITRILILLNGNPPRRAHNLETLKILLEHHD